MVLPRALIFDVDGTLADNERHGHRVAFNQAFKAAGLDWVWSEQRYGELLGIGGGKERIRHYVETTQPPLPSVTDLSTFILQLYLLKCQFYRQRLAQGDIPLRPGVLRLLRAAHQAGIRLAIATTSALSSAQALIDQLLGDEWTGSPTARSMGSLFEVIAAGDVVLHKKPAPDIYRYVLEKLDLGAGDCLAIEDSPVGLRAALGAGLKTIVTVNHYTQASDFSGAALVVSHLGEPQQPFCLISGDAGGSSQVDLALLERLAGAG